MKKTLLVASLLFGGSLAEACPSCAAAMDANRTDDDRPKRATSAAGWLLLAPPMLGAVVMGAIVRGAWGPDQPRTRALPS